ncbi:unnamed protein product [Effrenium voratum]|nr:unnamed protein product [Effrenium voratum]
MPREERKRQYTAIRRQLAKEVNSALACKWNASDDNQRFSMLKTWILNGSLDDIEIEEEFTRFAEESQNDMWTTCTLFQLEQMYGTTPEAAEFIAEVTKGQEGVPHPQAPGVAKARMFRVLKEVAENKLKGTKSTDKVARHA